MKIMKEIFRYPKLGRGADWFWTKKRAVWSVLKEERDIGSNEIKY